jgi:hypothetical protein
MIQQTEMPFYFWNYSKTQKDECKFKLEGAQLHETIGSQYVQVLMRWGWRVGVGSS